MTRPSRETAAQVAARANNRCEYCGMHQSLQGATFHLEHVVPESRGGNSEIENLAWCCPSCNLHKSDRIEAIDPETGKTVPLFNPRRGAWSEHLRLESHKLIGRTPIGRATVVALDLNHPRRISIRIAEQRLGILPPP
jgi:hypothetical protein